LPAIAVPEEDSSNNNKESVFGIMDDLLSHLNRTKKLFMALVISSFIVAPLAIILSILMFVPPFLAGVGQPQDVVFTAKGAIAEEAFAKRSSAVLAEPTPAMMVRIMPSDKDITQVNITGLHQIDKGAFLVDNSQIQLNYVPADAVEFRIIEAAQPMPPRFMYVGGSAPTASPFDVTWVIVAVIAVSVATAGAWLFIGVKEYRFFSNWNRRYSNYKEMQAKVDKELGDSTG
jgi:hypothetical protein